MNFLRFLERLTIRGPGFAARFVVGMISLNRP